MPDSLTTIIIILNLAGLAAVIWFLYTLRQRLTAGPNTTDEAAEQLKLRSMINQVFGEVSTTLAEQSKHVFRNEQEIIATDLKHRQAEIEKVVSELRTELKERQKEIHLLEKTRHEQFSQVATHIIEHQKITEKLSQDTSKLRNLLSNNQQRGQWGEYILEDILRAAGLVEDIHYTRQVAFMTKAKPDITLLLPNDRKVAIDVKFPYSAAIKLAEAETTAQKAEAKKLLITDVKAKVKQIIDRGYINPAEGTLDYAIMFVPNEDLFSFINQQATEVIEYAMNNKVMMVSPFTFLIVARTVMESYRNFMVENNLREIIKFIHDFVDEWGRFEGEFLQFDDRLSKLRQTYDKISSTRFSRMRLRIDRIQELETKSVGTIGTKGSDTAAGPELPPVVLNDSLL